MNTKQIQYALLLAEVGSFSQAAEKLNIAQPSLSKQILNLEQELGVKLFDRSTVSMKLTPAGTHFLKAARELLYQGDQLIRSMDEFKTEQKGRLTIGISPFRNLYMSPQIVKRIMAKYPGVQVVLREMSSDQLRKEATEGSFDFAIVNLPVDETVLDVTLLQPEQLVIAVPNEMLHLLSCEDLSNTAELDFSCFKDIPFVVVSQSQEMRRYFDKLCASHNITPNIAVEVAGGVTSAWSMTRAGLGATLLPKQLLENTLFGENLSFFTLSDPAYARQPAIVTRKDQYLPRYAQYAMDLLRGAVTEDATPDA